MWGLGSLHPHSTHNTLAHTGRQRQTQADTATYSHPHPHTTAQGSGTRKVILNHTQLHKAAAHVQRNDALQSPHAVDAAAGALGARAAAWAAGQPQSHQGSPTVLTPGGAMDVAATRTHQAHIHATQGAPVPAKGDTCTTAHNDTQAHAPMHAWHTDTPEPLRGSSGHDWGGCREAASTERTTHMYCCMGLPCPVKVKVQEAEYSSDDAMRIA